jgi:hypothetical protein
MSTTTTQAEEPEATIKGMMNSSLDLGRSRKWENRS